MGRSSSLVLMSSSRNRAAPYLMTVTAMKNPDTMRPMPHTSEDDEATEHEREPMKDDRLDGIRREPDPVTLGRICAEGGAQ